MAYNGKVIFIYLKTLKMKNMGFIYLMAGIALVIIGILTIRSDKSNNELKNGIIERAADLENTSGEHSVIFGKANTESGYLENISGEHSMYLGRKNTGEDCTGVTGEEKNTGEYCVNIGYKKGFKNDNFDGIKLEPWQESIINKAKKEGKTGIYMTTSNNQVWVSFSKP